MSEHGYCDKCGEDLGDHPTVNVEGINTLALCQDRAIKWKRVEPGTVIPAGQPYRVEFADKNLVAAREHRGDVQPFFADPRTVRPGGDPNAVYFIDSSWKPPLVLPTEPTWGMVLLKGPDRAGDSHRLDFGRWQADLTGKGTLERTHRSPFDTRCDVIARESVLDFIPLTDEQVARIEAAR